MVEISFNDPKKKIEKIRVNFVIVDNSHLTKIGVENLAKCVTTLFPATNPAERLMLLLESEKLN